MKKRNIYQNQSQQLLHLFEKAGSSKKVLCAPMDYAKNDYLVMFLNGHGDILRKPFSIKNSPEGIAYADEQVTRYCRRRGIKKKHVFSNAMEKILKRSAQRPYSPVLDPGLTTTSKTDLTIR